MPKGNKKTRVSMEIDADRLERLREYSQITGIPQVRVLREAIDYWLENVAPIRLKGFKEEGRKK
jgi:predicted DNA-binding protein